MSTEVWLRGAIEGIAPLLQPVAHSLLQVREEMAAVIPTLSADQVAATPGGAASVSYHARHMAGSIDRLFTYARGESLSEAQLAALRAEAHPSPVTPEGLLDVVHGAIDGALAELHSWSARGDALLEPRTVGRSRLPSTVLGLLFHTAEHTQRHAGQIATTALVLRGARR